MDLFGVPMDSRTQGSVQSYSPTGVMASSRTYNSPLGGGTFGRPAALAAGDLVEVGRPGQIIGCGTPTTPE